MASVPDLCKLFTFIIFSFFLLITVYVGVTGICQFTHKGFLLLLLDKAIVGLGLRRAHTLVPTCLSQSR